MITRVRRGLLLATAGFCLLPVLDGLAKTLIDDLHVVQIVWARLLFQTIVVVAWLGATGRLRLAASDRPVLLSGTVAATWLANFPIIFSLAYLPLADAFALLMAAPLMVTALAAPLLGERVGTRRWIAVVAGFAGAMIIIRPGLGVFHWAAILPLMSALLFALYQLGARELGASHRPGELILHASLWPLLASSMIVPWFWTTPDASEWIRLILIGAGAGAGHFLLIRALGLAPASLLAPVAYVQMISSVVFGLAVFGDVPGAATIAGAAVIVAAGLHTMRGTRGSP